MFKRVFQSLSKTFSSREEPKQPAPRSTSPTPPPPAEKKGSIVDKLAAAPLPAAKKKAATPSLSPDELCGVTSSMNKDQIRAKLALLYRRHNRASSSLDAKMRAEAEKMLSAVVAVREKYFGPI